MKNRNLILKLFTVTLLMICFTGCNKTSVEDEIINTTEEEIEEKPMEDEIIYEYGDEILDVNGVKLSVKQAGSGPDMILIHGRTLSKEAMDNLFDYYKENYHVISYDVRGHGESESDDKCTLDDLSDDLIELIDAYNLNKPVVIGFSMGSYITLRTAERYPDLFNGIVLIGTRGKGHVSSFRIDDIVADAMETFDNMADISNVSIPVLVMNGENDFINPSQEGQKVVKGIADGEFILVPSAGHEAYRENPDFVIEQIDIFLGFLKSRVARPINICGQPLN